MTSLCIPILMFHQTMMQKIITFSTVFISVPRYVFSFTKETDSNSISKFNFLFSFENWEEIFLEENVNIIFNNFLNNCLRTFMQVFQQLNHKIPIKQNHG